ncbi:hypothetical protein [Amycolatopsis dongchuanensis]|uniref:Uncharacterized protein n=1 Tax=Amycolatopsis dongchuanensis TaxID=1070866 RepID=A0ABP8VGC4_9PSEU
MATNYWFAHDTLAEDDDMLAHEFGDPGPDPDRIGTAQVCCGIATATATATATMATDAPQQVAS